MPSLYLILLVLVLILLIFRFLLPGVFVSKVKTVNGENVENVIPAVPRNFLFGNNFLFLSLDLESAFQILRDFAKTFKKSYLLHSFNLPVYNVIKAEDAEPILSSQHLMKKGIIYASLDSFLGTGLLTGHGTKWLFRRRLLTPAFHFNILQKFLEIFKEESEKFVTCVYEKHVDTITSLEDIVPRFTLNNICETALGVKLDQSKEGDEYRKNINTIEDFMVKRQINVWFAANIIYLIFGPKLKYEQFVANAHRFSSNIIKKRRSQFVLGDDQIKNENIYEKKKNRYAMLDTLLAAEARGENIDHKGICEEVDTFMFEGYDTTSVAVTFSLLMLATHRDIQQKVFEEVKDISDSVSDLTISDFNNMKYLDCFVKETLRLYPSVPLISREIEKKSTIGNLIFPQMGQILIHIFDIHRDPNHYPEPEKFIPERFLPENSVDRHPFAYLPFSAGPRNCIGQKFALLEIKVLLVDILMNYEVHPVTKVEDIIFISGLVLRTKSPIKVKFTKRKM